MRSRSSDYPEFLLIIEDDAVFCWAFCKQRRLQAPRNRYWKRDAGSDNCLPDCVDEVCHTPKQFDESPAEEAKPSNHCRGDKRGEDSDGCPSGLPTRVDARLEVRVRQMNWAKIVHVFTILCV